jgi:hypothetical protein
MRVERVKVAAGPTPSRIGIHNRGITGRVASIKATYRRSVDHRVRRGLEELEGEVRGYLPQQLRPMCARLLHSGPNMST